jgi:hypothetical protein
MTHRFAPLAFALLALVGCATPSERRLEVRDDESFAMHILRAADISGLRDAPREAAMNFGGLETGVVGASDIGRVGHVALSALNPVGGASALGAGLGAGFLSFFMVPGDAPAESSAIVAWAPKSFADTSAEAEIKLLALLKKAFQSAVTGTEFENYEFTEGEIEDRFSSNGEMTRSFKYVNRQGRCAEMEYGRCQSVIAVGNRSHARLEPAPLIIGSGERWEFSPNRGLIKLWPLARDSEFPHYYRAMADELGLYTTVSAQLPEWVFIYVAPNRMGFRDENGGLKLYPLPVILNQGRAHYFVKGARGGQDLRTSF